MRELTIPSELYFKRRIARMLRKKGYLVILTAIGEIYDLVAIRKGIPFVIEIKGKKTSFSPGQKELQRKLADKSGAIYCIITQLKRKGKFTVEGSTELKQVLGGE